MFKKACLALLVGGILLGAAQSAEARWYRHHFGHYRHHGVRHYGYRHYGVRHYGYRHYGYRPFYRYSFPRVYHYPRYRYSYRSFYPRYGVSWYNPVRFYAPRVYFPSVYYSYPTCYSYSGGYWFAQTDSTPTATPVRSAPVEAQTPTMLAQASEPSWSSIPYSTVHATNGAQSKVIENGKVVQPGGIIQTASYRREAPLAPTWTVDAQPSVESLTANERLLNFGDRLFRGNFYREALSKYEDACEATPNSGELQFRRGYALVALGRYQDAAEAFKRGVEVDPAYARSNFRVQRLYGVNQDLKTQHVERLAKEALSRDGDSDLVFVIGVILHFEGETDRAKTFFKRAQTLAGPEAVHLRCFLGADASGDKLAGDVAARREQGRT